VVYKKFPRRQLIDGTFDILNRIHFFTMLRAFNPGNLTVLNYHRVTDPNDPCCDTFKPNISATPDMFDRQIAYMKQNFDMVSASDFSAYLGGSGHLPSHAAIITFDDGYSDNYTIAYPVLKKHGVSALIFITTDFVGLSKPSFWDVAACAFAHTEKTSAILPLTGEQTWSNDREKHSVMMRWIEMLKTVPEAEKQEYARQLPVVLAVESAITLCQDVFMTWDQVREMGANGIEFGSHTLTHPIMTRIPHEQVKRELVESKQLIEQEIGKPVVTFAYPNGGPEDFNPGIIAELRDAGYMMAFSLMPGYNRYPALRQDPYTIRRIFLSHSDSFPRFVAKVNGIRKIS
jgi:peptidoglycan/xylan/chitin deacetylase (PgdA/CDA1 family)